ncbi:MAG TPA: nitroreductase family deazaflavin-dependent oxidoreductase [Promineifilum sp.]|nr:nitroreductase family deazaflavin-dependent oxidoreductase [Promineifilum sp.]
MANPARGAVRRVIATRPAAWLLARTIHYIDRAVLRLSGGRTTAAALFSGLPVLAVTTTGAKSGQPRTVPLVAVPDGDRLILIASNWGQSRHPGWYYNMKANPAVRVVGGDGPPGRLYMAREVAGEERAACWAKAVAVYPGYEAYARRAGREIGVVVLTLLEDLSDLAALAAAVEEPERDYEEYLAKRNHGKS